MRLTARISGLALGALAILAVVFVVGMRRKSPVVQDAVRRFNKTVFNPRQMRSAGTPGAYASIIRHVGRSTGAPYETPVGVVTTEDGFVIVLPYGTRPDWLRNVMAAGSAVLVHEGRTYPVDRPEVGPIESAAVEFSPEDDRAHRIFGVEQCLHLRRVESG